METAVKTQNKYQVSIDLLNDAVGKEIATSLQYMYFRLAMQLEQSTIDSYNEASRIAAEHKDAVTHKMFQDIIVEEEEHLDTFRTELQHMLDYGEEYLALQSAAGSKHTAKSFKHTDDGRAPFFLMPGRYPGRPADKKTAAAAVRDDNFVSLCILIL